MVRSAVAVFPGSNCDQDAYHALEVLGHRARYLWHEDTALEDIDLLVLPGGFSYGDYLRTGAIARFSPLMRAVPEFLERGGLVLGICNGFQILLEAGLLPGAMMQNSGLKFVCRHVYLRVENADTPFTNAARPGQVLRIPIAHHAGNYYADANTIALLEANGQVVLRYCDERGEVGAESNPNGSLGNIAGIVNERRNVFGLMPHPERACERILGSEDGRVIFDSIAAFVEGRVGIAR